MVTANNAPSKKKAAGKKKATAKVKGKAHAKTTTDKPKARRKPGPRKLKAPAALRGRQKDIASMSVADLARHIEHTEAVIAYQRQQVGEAGEALTEAMARLTLLSSAMQDMVLRVDHIAQHGQPAPTEPDTLPETPPTPAE